MIENLRARWIHILLFLSLLVGLSPTPIPQPILDPIRSAQIAIQSGRFDSALESLERAMVFEPALDGLHLLAAEMALAAGAPHVAKYHLEASASFAPLSSTYACLYIRILLALGNTAEAAGYWKRFDDHCPEEALILKDFGQAYLNENDPITAQAILEELIAIDPDDVEVRLSLAKILVTRQPEEAIKHLRAVNEMTPNGNPLTQALLRAIEDARPHENPAYTLAQVGQTLARHGEWTAAGWAFEKALEHNPEYVEAQAYLGLALDRAGADGLQDLQIAAEASSTETLPHIFLAHLWLERDLPDLARAELEIAAQLDPSNPVVAAELGTTYAELGDIPAAIAAFRHATDLAPDEPNFWLLLAQFSISHEIEVRALGLPAARNAVTLDPDDPAALDALGYAHLLLGDLLLAERHICRAVVLEPTGAASQFHLGLLRQAQGDSLKAEAAYKMALLLDPNGSIGQLAERVLSQMYP